MDHSTFKRVIDFDEAKQILEQMRRDRGYPSGYEDLDRLCGGLVKDGVTLIAARPAMGKTSLALNIVSRLSTQQDGTILIFSPNVWSDEIAMHLLSISTGLSPTNFLDDQVPSSQVAEKLLDFYRAKESRIKIDVNSFATLDHIWEHCCNIPDLRLVVIDPVDAICKPANLADKSARWDEPEDPAVLFQSLQQLAQHWKVPVLCTAHLHRSLERRQNKRPHLGDLKKIGISKEMLDQIIFLYRDRYYDPEGTAGAELIVARVAQGDVGTIRLDWDYDTRRFTESDWF